MTGSGAVAWERISSRKNGAVLRLRRLGADPAFRRELGETVLDGEKLLREALASGCRVTELLADEKRLPESTPPGARLFCAPEELVSYASPVKNSPGPVFSVSLPSIPEPCLLYTSCSPRRRSRSGCRSRCRRRRSRR